VSRFQLALRHLSTRSARDNSLLNNSSLQAIYPASFRNTFLFIHLAKIIFRETFYRHNGDTVTKAEKALEKFKAGYNCAQAVVFSYADQLKIDKNTALKIATGFGGGMGRKQEVCGAVTGALMVLGVLYGRGESDGREKLEQTYMKVQEFMDLFSIETGSVNCGKLLDGCLLLTAEGKKRFVEQKLIEKCYSYVTCACTILDKMIAESP
jgi:C_GCAxxG_C_C family probable redox protein